MNLDPNQKVVCCEFDLMPRVTKGLNLPIDTVFIAGYGIVTD
jgi:hypothetical protein